jgi:hypothetical protein
MDDAIRDLPNEVIEKYGMSLDIEDLGDLSKLPEPPTIFECAPLSASKARMDKGPRNTNDDWWVLFAFHVTGVENMDGELTFEGNGPTKHLSDKCRDLFPDSFIRDIGRMISRLGNGDAPFALPGGTMETIITRRQLAARSQETNALMAAAILNESE